MTTAGTEPILNLPEGELENAVANARKAAQAQKGKAEIHLKDLRNQRAKINDQIREATARLDEATRVLAALTPRKPRTPNTKAAKP